VSALRIRNVIEPTARRRLMLDPGPQAGPLVLAVLAALLFLGLLFAFGARRAPSALGRTCGPQRNCAAGTRCEGGRCRIPVERRP